CHMGVWKTYGLSSISHFNLPGQALRSAFFPTGVSSRCACTLSQCALHTEKVKIPLTSRGGVVIGMLRLRREDLAVLPGSAQHDSGWGAGAMSCGPGSRGFAGDYYFGLSC